MLPRVYTIEPNPHWVIIDNFSKLPDGAAIFTYRSLDKTTFKPAYQDSAGMIPYRQPIVGFGNGTMPPIYWEFDPNNPTETYYIRVYDNQNLAIANFLWDFDGLSGGTGGGGGGTIIFYQNIANLVVNDIFFRNVGNITGGPSLATSITIAPSNNAGFVNDPTNANVIANGPVGPDIIFAKNNETASDNISFIPFFPLQPLTGDVTPRVYMQYSCTVAGAGETYKYVQFPIVQGVATLSAISGVTRIYAQCTAGNSNLILQWRQFFGSGGAPSTDVITPIAIIDLTPTWDVYDNVTTIPSVTTATLGTCPNSALFLEIGYPLNATTTIDIAKIAAYLGTTTPPGIDFVSNDGVDAVVNSPRTGDIRTSLNSVILGWAIMNDGTIGDAASNATTRANADTFPLFDLIWQTFNGSPALQALAPMFTSAATPVAYGTSSVADFVANNQISLTKEAGRVMAGVSGSNLIGTTLGAASETLTPANLPNPLTTGAFSVGVNVTAGAVQLIGSNGGSNGATISNAGGGNSFSLYQPTVFLNVFIKL